MKAILPGMFILFSMIQTFAQDKVIIYMNEEYEMVNQTDSAKYIREAIIKDNGYYYITDKYIDGTTYSYYELSSLNPRVLDGLSIDYNENNDYYSQGYYKNDNMIGSWLYYDETGNIDTVIYKEPKTTKFRRAQYHRNSKKTKELGYQVIDSLNSFLKNNFHLPPRARDGSKSFQVLINCTIGKNGDVLWHQIVYPDAHKDIYQEISRLMDNFLFKHKAGRAFEISVVLKYGVQPHIDDDPVYTIVEDMPEFLNKDYNNSFYRYIEDTQDEKFKNCLGSTAVYYVIEKDGSISNIEIQKEIEDCPGYKEEIERILKSSPKWQPGKQRDKPVRVKGIVFISFGKDN